LQDDYKALMTQVLNYMNIKKGMLTNGIDFFFLTYPQVYFKYLLL